MASSLVSYQITHDNIALLRLLGTGKHLLSLALINDFNKAVRRAVDDNVVGLITVHSGNSFSGGLDYNSAPEAVLVGAFASLIASLIKLPFPTVAKVTGQAYGAGFTLALAHDYLVLSTDSTVSLCQNELTEGHEVPSFAAALLFGKFPPSAAWELAVSTVPVAPPNYSPISDYVGKYVGWSIDDVATKLLEPAAGRVGTAYSAVRKSLLAEVWALVKPTVTQA
ncbi:enoyl-CoA delta isomerase 1, peroxisomal-like [Ananas comosus]|uniref:Enoyl-CoA delta isomerase 1, peroxisomal-like n=1 Tax=Ananas comosus TaxID=4615 RepID=A0A6P5F9L9_ANACO|nr:enoyl-CoA delta isomerase 1, peroxisomal-like [Ananas comosus]